MRSLRTILWVSVFLTVLDATTARAQEYTILRITNNGYTDVRPQINNNGTLVWTGHVGDQTGEIFMYQGGLTVRITTNTREDINPRINDNDYIVWQGHDGNDWEIFLYDGTFVVQLTDNTSNDIDPQIDNDNHVVWRRYGGYSECTNSAILLHDGSGETQISDASSCKSSPEVSKAGYVVWKSYICGRWGVACMLFSPADLYVFDGISTHNLTQSPDRWEDSPQINDQGHVVFLADREVFLHDGAVETRLTFNDANEGYPQINRNGHVVFTGSAPGEIFYYDGTSVSQLTNTGYSELGPQINATDTVVWAGEAGIGCGPYVSEVFVHKGSSTIRLTDNCWHDAYPEINDDGWITWGYGEIYLAIPQPANLRVTGLTAPAAVPSGASFSVTDTTKNDGPATADASHTGIWLSTNKTLGGDTLLATRAVATLAAGAVSKRVTQVTVPLVPPGIYYLIAEADTDREVAEINETDNLKVRSLIVGPDLTVTMTLTPPVPTSTAPTAIAVTTTNAGGDTAVGFTTRLYRSRDSKIDASDTLLDEFAVSALAPKQTSTGTVTVMLPAGTYYLIAQADATNAVIEAKETNNLKKVKRTVP